MWELQRFSPGMLLLLSAGTFLMATFPGVDGGVVPTMTLVNRSGKDNPQDHQNVTGTAATPLQDVVEAAAASRVKRGACDYQEAWPHKCESNCDCERHRYCTGHGYCHDKGQGATSFSAKTGTSGGCNWGYCEQNQHIAFGDLTIAEQRTHSTFGAKAGAYQSALGNSVSADAHLAHVVEYNDVGEVEANVGRVGASAHYGAGGIGAGVDATLGEAQIKLGKGPWSVGIKPGLGVDTGVAFGKTEFKVKALGTGIVLGHKNGFELCLLGSCVSIG